MTEHKLHAAHFTLPRLSCSPASGPWQRGPSLCHPPAAQLHPSPAAAALPGANCPPGTYISMKHLSRAWHQASEHKGPCAGSPKHSYKWKEEPHRQTVLSSCMISNSRVNTRAARAATEEEGSRVETLVYYKREAN